MLRSSCSDHWRYGGKQQRPHSRFGLACGEWSVHTGVCSVHLAFLFFTDVNVLIQVSTKRKQVHRSNFPLTSNDDIKFIAEMLSGFASECAWGWGANIAIPTKILQTNFGFWRNHKITDADLDPQRIHKNYRYRFQIFEKEKISLQQSLSRQSIKITDSNLDLQKINSVIILVGTVFGARNVHQVEYRLDQKYHLNNDSVGQASVWFSSSGNDQFTPRKHNR